MLRQLRNKKTAKKIWIVLAILILPAFVFWGFGSMARSKREEKYAGSISGKKVDSQDLQDSIMAVRNQALIQFGDNFSAVEKSLNLESQGWDRLLLLNEAKKRKINVSDKEVITHIQNFPFFQAKGVFDSRIYNQMLTYVFRTQARIFEEQTRQNLTISKLYRELTDNLKADDAQVREEYRSLNETKSVYYIAAHPAEFLKNIAVADEELKNYFTKNPLQFKLPLSFNAEYVELAASQPNEALTKDKVKKVYSRLLKNEPFDKVAKEYSVLIKETGFFPETGPIPGIGWSQELLSLINKSKTGLYLNPIYVDKSYYIFRIKERKEPYIPVFDSIKNNIKEALIKEKSQFIAKEIIENCLKSLKKLYADNPKKTDFNKQAKKFKLKSAVLDPFTSGSYLEGIGSSDKFWAAADKLKENEFSDVLDMPSGFYIIRLKSKTPIDEKKFDAEKADLTQRTLQQKKQDVFNKFIESLKKQGSKDSPD